MLCVGSWTTLLLLKMFYLISEFFGGVFRWIYIVSFLLSYMYQVERHIFGRSLCCQTIRRVEFKLLPLESAQKLLK